MTRFTVTAAVVALALVLSGCTPEAEPVATPTAEPAPEPSVEPALRPNPVFAIDCAEMLSLAEVQERVTARIAVKRDESNVPGEVSQIPLLQRGGLNCVWGTEGTWQDDVEVLLMPDAPDVVAERATDPFTQDFSVTGAEAAVGSCYFGSDPVDGLAPGGCIITALVGTSAMELRFIDSFGAYSSEAAIGEVAVDILELVIERTSAAGPRSQEWVAPSDSLDADAAFCDSVGADLLAALELDTPFGGPVSNDDLAELSSCQYFFGATDVLSIGAWVVDGAAWAAGVEQTEGPHLGDLYEPRTTTSNAQWWLSPSGQAVRGRAAMGGSLVELVVYWGDLDVTIEQAQAAIGAVMEQYADVPPGT
ncbi:hypothetical protein [Microcella sp.]|uniref:hypothetical protein n=1 Tax=Microcella sp. TaxID=1913979 RepID=UPI00256145BC|nr:hypothetical protein [Microcella sp.]MBX9471259.1 hypothetical protein [Microcella sp.]